MTRILLIDDNPEFGDLVKQGLRPSSVQQALTISQTETLLEKDRFDLFLIDVTLPDGDGFELCRKLNDDPVLSGIPKIFLTARDRLSEKVFGFNCGADDYVTKPCSIAELRVRVERLFKKMPKAEEESLTVGRFEFNTEFQKCTIVDEERRKELNLTPTEFRLFFILAKAAGHVLSRQDLEREVWRNNGVAVELRGIDSHICHLRKKLGVYKNAVVSVYGRGYSFDAAAKTA